MTGDFAAWEREMADHARDRIREELTRSDTPIYRGLTEEVRGRWYPDAGER